MLDAAFIDSLLVRMFRFRTRSFLHMAPADGAVPPVPAAGAYLYVHIPFCPVLCPFCSFHRVPHHGPLARNYFASLRTEITRYHAAGHRFTGVYFGGGTPTCEPGELLATIALVRELFGCLLYTSPSPRDRQKSRMPSSA